MEGRVYPMKLNIIDLTNIEMGFNIIDRYLRIGGFND